jgi:hypothetical protein
MEADMATDTLIINPILLQIRAEDEKGKRLFIADQLNRIFGFIDVAVLVTAGSLPLKEANAIGYVLQTAKDDLSAIIEGLMS